MKAKGHEALLELMGYEGEALRLLDALGVLGDGSSSGVEFAQVDEVTPPREPVEMKELVEAMAPLRQRVMGRCLAALWLARKAKWP